MITHILLLRVAEGADRSQVEKCLRDVTHLRIPGFSRAIVAEDLGLRKDSWHYALVCEFPSVEDYRRYDDDDHHARIKRAIGPMVESIARVQVDLGAQSPAV